MDILGRMKVQEAVPVLEDLVRNGEGIAPQSAADALFFITGHKRTYLCIEAPGRGPPR